MGIKHDVDQQYDIVNYFFPTRCRPRIGLTLFSKGFTIKYRTIPSLAPIIIYSWEIEITIWGRVGVEVRTGVQTIAAILHNTCWAVGPEQYRAEPADGTEGLYSLQTLALIIYLF